MRPFIDTIKTVCVTLILLIIFSCNTTESPITKNGVTDTVSVKDTALKHQVQDRIPQPVGFVNDYEKLFTPSQKDSLETMMKEFEKETTIQIAVITLDSTMTTAATLDETTLQMSKAWGVGQKNKNNGIVIGFSGFYRKIRIRNGTGVEGILTDAATKKIIDEDFIPFFKQGNYYLGLKSGLLSLMRQIRGKYTA